MAKRVTEGRSQGFYRMLVSRGEEETDEGDGCLEVEDEADLEEGVFIVERVVERRVRRVSLKLSLPRN